ncbi:hypothetical protein H8958_006384 [Nasalis larvatus]
MSRCRTLESQEGANSEEKGDSSIEDPKETIVLAFVRVNPGAQNRLQNAQQQGKKKRKKKRLGLKAGEWGAMLMIGDQSIQLPPFVIDGFKFDLRIYVLVTSCDPLRIFVYNEGLARFATTSYSRPCTDNLDDICMHLTNYSINKHSSNFSRDAHSGSKRKLSSFNAYMEDHSYNVEQIWRDIEDVIIKTLISAHPIVRHNYHTCFPSHTLSSACFEVLGFDILLDRRLKPWLLEVNHSPSFSTDSRLDKEVKDGLLYDTLVLINLESCDKKKVLEEERQRGQFLQQCCSREMRIEEVRGFRDMQLKKTETYEKENCGGFRLIYPSLNSEKYEKFFQDNNSLFQNTVASRAREEYARLDMLEKGTWNSLPLRPVMSIPQGECLPAQRIPNPRDIHLFFMGRQLIQELRLKREKKPFQMKKKYIQPLTLVSCTPDLLLSVQDERKNETDSSFHEEAPMKEAGPVSPKPTSARPSSSVPDLRNISLSSSELEPSKPNFSIKEAKSASAVNVFTGTVTVTDSEEFQETVKLKRKKGESDVRCSGTHQGGKKVSTVSDIEA